MLRRHHMRSYLIGATSPESSDSTARSSIRGADARHVTQSTSRLLLRSSLLDAVVEGIADVESPLLLTAAHVQILRLTVAGIGRGRLQPIKFPTGIILIAAALALSLPLTPTMDIHRHCDSTTPPTGTPKLSSSSHADNLGPITPSSLPRRNTDVMLVSLI
ncbi:hypothetical protein B7494_g1496 [Chlorociboria aeruginascens]|nr:hypothetical protein B7494_g1496 [Chlorociboria aeruginascens]